MSEADTRQLLDAAWERLSARKLRLLACALARQSWDLLTDRRSQLAVEVAESYADGGSSDRDRYLALNAAQAAVDGLTARYARIAEGEADPDASPDEMMRRIEAASLALGTAMLYPHRWIDAPGLAPLVRDLLGPPVCPVVDPAWLDWNRGLVRAMAGEIYESRHFDQLPILADALEEAGCTDPDLLGHCRAAAPHARGCWLLDLLLDREPNVPGGLILRGQALSPYWTVMRPLEVEERYIRQSGGRAAFARVWIHVEPRPGAEGIVFRMPDVVRRQIPNEYLPGVVEGLRDHLAVCEGRREDVAGLAITLTRGQEHSVVSNRAAFRIAAATALSRALEQAGLLTTS
jgi:hypothetical protein